MVFVGIFLMLVGATSLYVFWRKNEWRIPIFEVNSFLEKGNSPTSRNKAYSRFRGWAVIMALSMWIIYATGACLIIIKYDYLWLFIIIWIIGIWLLKAVIGLVRAGYSKKVHLLNYLYSPYLLAWRRDNWSSFTDNQVADAICEATKVDPASIKPEDNSFDSFLIALSRVAGSPHLAEQYPQILDDLKRQASEMIRI